MYLSFINDCLIKGKAGIFDTVKKVNLDTLKIMKKIRKVVSVIKEARQASKLMLGGRSEARRSVLVSCYISVIKLGISRFDS